MMHLTVNLLLHSVVLSAPGHDYATAFKQTEETGRPLVVLVGADWCPGCRQMKYTTIPDLEKRGGLRKVAFAYVNTDQQRTLARKLMSGSSIPQLVLYRKTDDGWTRKQLTGAQSTTSVATFIKTAVEQPTAEVGQRQ